MIADIQPNRAPVSCRAGDALLAPDQHARIVEGYASLMDLGPETEPRLRAVIEHVLAHPGSLLRAQLAFGILLARGVAEERALSVSVALEYFHSASLVFDDMPSMDDAQERRGAACAHVVHGEAAATLGALALINRGYALLWDAIGDLAPADGREAAQLVADCLGARGILNGQSRDLNFRDSARRERDVLDVAAGKTVTLIRLTLLLPAIVGGADAPTRAALEQLAVLWGLSYQVMDDFKDCLMSAAETGKTAARDGALEHPNLPATIGRERAWARLTAMQDEARAVVTRLAGRDAAWNVLERLQDVLDREQARIKARLAAPAAA